METRTQAGAEYSLVGHLGEFKGLSMDCKLNVMIQKLLKLDEMGEKIESVERLVNMNSNDIAEVRADLRSFECRMRTLEYIAIDQEARGRRQTLILGCAGTKRGEH